jgi:hypothetical protein
MRRLSRIGWPRIRLACLAVLAGTLLLACGGNGPEDAPARHPALELLEFVPDYPEVAGCWMDDRTYLDAIGLGYVDTQEELESIDTDRWMDTPSWLYAFWGAQPLLWEEELTTKAGVEPLSVQEHLTIPYPEWSGGEFVGVRRLPIDESRFTEALLDLGYERQQYADDEYFEISADVALESNSYVPVEMWRAWISDDLLLDGGSMLEDALDAFRGRLPSLGQREDVAESMEALGSIHMACVVDGDQPRRQLREEVEGLAEILSDEPGWPEVVESLKSQYADWGKLYEPDLFVVAYVAEGDTGTMKLALWYEDPEIATAVRPELERRMREYAPYPLLEGHLCDDVRTFSVNRVVVGECTGGLADNWFALFRSGGFFFLTDDLSSGEPAPCPMTGEPCT